MIKIRGKMNKIENRKSKREKSMKPKVCSLERSLRQNCKGRLELG